METALVLARRGLGRVWPNPAVGCVLVRPDLGGRIVGRGWTQPGGRPHAETEALHRAGNLAKGATAYVSLEPCAHHGKTAPCAEALVKAGVRRVVVACEDPDPRVSGKGVAVLKKAGIEVDVGVGAGEARALNAGFFLRISEDRPFVTLKTATSLDGRIATSGGESKWITGDQARRIGQLLRARNDAILVGIGTVLADDPALTCRLPGMEEHTPLRVVADGKLRIPLNSQLVETAAEYPTWVLALPDCEIDRKEDLTKRGVTVIETQPDRNRRLDIGSALNLLAKRGITRLLIEGGGHISAAFMRAGMIDRLSWFRAPGVIGGDGTAAIADFGVSRLSGLPRFVRVDASAAGSDMYEEYRREE
ncbi:MAG: bifunctional diaminohydroxyphosphoribosylaminopyrimidine deaminase/5-amino-6-(5-phosphoribosylamino)uracil reductase RibD [Rhodospirillales bacterium]|nr:bifunctional diaminohydroxyphosphoribosylaminopyrimidine deaminase/5-amino-6-(5-phosphoribosylamino)uracil reductase RibD [Rhodospirillales bacterium]